MIPLVLAIAAAPDPGALVREADRVFASYAERSPRENALAIERLVDQGDFPGRPRLVYWLGTQYLTLNEVAAAERWYARVRSDHPYDDWSHRALLGLGEVAARRHRFLAAEAYFREAADRLPGDRLDALERAARARTLLYRFAAFLVGGAAALFLAARAALAVARRRAPMRTPFEVKLLAPLAAVLAAMAFALTPDGRTAVLVLAGGMPAVLYANALCLADRPRWPALHLLHAALAAVGLVYGALYVSGLIEPTLETLRVGAER